MPLMQRSYTVHQASKDSGCSLLGCGPLFFYIEEPELINEKICLASGHTFGPILRPEAAHQGTERVQIKPDGLFQVLDASSLVSGPNVVLGPF